MSLSLPSFPSAPFLLPFCLSCFCAGCFCPRVVGYVLPSLWNRSFPFGIPNVSAPVFPMSAFSLSLLRILIPHVSAPVSALSLLAPIQPASVHPILPHLAAFVGLKVHPTFSQNAESNSRMFFFFFFCFFDNIWIFNFGCAGFHAGSSRSSGARLICTRPHIGPAGLHAGPFISIFARSMSIPFLVPRFFSFLVHFCFFRVVLLPFLLGVHRLFVVVSVATFRFSPCLAPSVCQSHPQSCLVGLVVSHRVAQYGSGVLVVRGGSWSCLCSPPSAPTIGDLGARCGSRPTSKANETFINTPWGSGSADFPSDDDVCKDACEDVPCAPNHKTVSRPNWPWRN